MLKLESIMGNDLGKEIVTIKIGKEIKYCQLLGISIYYTSVKDEEKKYLLLQFLYR